MLFRIDSYGVLDERKLMDLYVEGNLENAEELDPEGTDRSKALKRAEAEFLHFLKTDFFQRAGNEYWILEENGLWVSALRASRIQDGFYYLEALETRPDCRRRGYGEALLTEVLAHLAELGPFRLCDCIHKKNLPSLELHKKCGFRIVSEAGLCYLNGTVNDRAYGMEYRFPQA